MVPAERVDRAREGASSSSRDGKGMLATGLTASCMMVWEMVTTTRPLGGGVGLAKRRRPPGDRATKFPSRFESFHTMSVRHNLACDSGKKGLNRLMTL